MKPFEVEKLLSTYGSKYQANGEELVTSSDEEARRARSSYLSGVLKTCQDLWDLQSEELDLVAEKIGNGSRDVAWRVPYGDSGLLNFFVEVLASQKLRQALAIHSLRVVGNSCADVDENRARLVEDENLKNVVTHLDDMSLTPFTVPVIYNILVDHEPSQLLASKLQAHSKLLHVLSSSSISEYGPIIPYIAQILRFLVAHEPEETLSMPDTVLLLLKELEVPQSKDDEDDPKDFLTIATTIAAYLANEKVQKALVDDESKHPSILKVFDVFHHCVVSLGPQTVGDEESAENLKQLSRALLTFSSDISALENFPKRFPPGTRPWAIFREWLDSDNYQLQTAACLSLGNLSRSDEASLAMVTVLKAHEPIAKVLADPSCTDMQLLHAAIAFGRNLAIPEQNRSYLGQMLLKPGVMPRMLNLDTIQQVQFAAISLIRLLLVGSVANARLLCEPLEGEENGRKTAMTILDEIIALFKKSDVEPTKLEAARAIMTLCRVMHSSAFTAVEEKRALVYKHHELHTAMAFLITQPKWPILRSEAWFILAVMSRSQDAVPSVLRTLESEPSRAALTEAITGRKTGETAGIIDHADEGERALSMPDAAMEMEPQQIDSSQQADMQMKDAENAMIMCTEILKMESSGLNLSTRSLLEDLVNQDTLVVAKQREKKIS